jgi:hypothetical protein
MTLADLPTTLVELDVSTLNIESWDEFTTTHLPDICEKLPKLTRLVNIPPPDWGNVVSLLHNTPPRNLLVLLRSTIWCTNTKYWDLLVTSLRPWVASYVVDAVSSADFVPFILAEFQNMPLQHKLLLVSRNIGKLNSDWSKLVMTLSHGLERFAPESDMLGVIQHIEALQPKIYGLMHVVDMLAEKLSESACAYSRDFIRSSLSIFLSSSSSRPLPLMPPFLCSKQCVYAHYYFHGVQHTLHE